MAHALPSPQPVDHSTAHAPQLPRTDAVPGGGIEVLMAELPEPGMTMPLLRAVSLVAAHVPAPYVGIALAIHRGKLCVDPSDDLTDDLDLVLRRC